MHRDGRYRRYFSDERLAAQMRDTVSTIERWSAQTGIAPKHSGFPEEMLPGATPDLPAAAE